MDHPRTGGEGALPELSAAVSAMLTREWASPLAPGLYIVATPIGNLADIGLRALSILARADHICCEDTRHSAKLLNAYSIAGGRLVPYHDHNGERQRPKILAWLAGGAAVALISDAGTPLIADPGYKLVREVHQAGYQVHAVPGASATIAALSIAGLPTDSFHFAGFLPAKTAARRRRLDELAAIPATLALYETAPRLAETLHDLGVAMAGREIAIAREITKRFETLTLGTLPLAAPPDDAVKGELVLLIGPPMAAEIAEKTIREATAEALQRLSLRDAVDEVTRTLRVPRRLVYALALELQKVES